MHRTLLIFGLLCISLCLAQTRTSDLIIMGLHGRVKSVLNHTERLSTNSNDGGTKDLKLDLPIPGSGNQWTAYDEQGLAVESGSVDANGKVLHVVRIQRDAEGHQTGMRSEVPGKPAETRTWETTERPGMVETRRYLDGKPEGHSESRRAEGSMATTKARSYDANEKLEHEFDADPERRTTTQVMHGANGEVRLRVVQRRNADRQLLEQTEFDGAGKMIRTFRFNDDGLTYAWQDPDERMPGRVSRTLHHDGKSHTWVLYPGGSWEHWVVSLNQGRRQEPEEELRIDNLGNVTEKLTFQYERDANENWTSRTVSAWRSASNQTTLIQRDTRTITYYEAK